MNKQQKDGYLEKRFFTKEPCIHKNPVYDLADHESPIAQWLERPTGILEGHGFDSRWGTRKIFFPSIRLQNTSPFIFTLSKSPSHLSEG